MKRSVVAKRFNVTYMITKYWKVYVPGVRWTWFLNSDARGAKYESADKYQQMLLQQN